MYSFSLNYFYPHTQKKKALERTLQAETFTILSINMTLPRPLAHCDLLLFAIAASTICAIKLKTAVVIEKAVFNMLEAS